MFGIGLNLRKWINTIANLINVRKKVFLQFWEFVKRNVADLTSRLILVRFLSISNFLPHKSLSYKLALQGQQLRVAHIDQIRSTPFQNE